MKKQETAPVRGRKTGAAPFLGCQRRSASGRQKPIRLGSNRSCGPASLSDPQIFCGFLAAVRNHLVTHLGTLIQVAEAGLLDSRNVDEHVLAAVVGLNEPITL